MALLIIDRRGQERPGERRWRIVTRWISGTLLLLCGLVVLGVEGCAAVEVAAGRARVSSVWFWISLTAIGGYLTLTGLEALLIGSKKMMRPLYRLLTVASAFKTGGPRIRLPPPAIETPGERALWSNFWARLRRRRTK